MEEVRNEILKYFVPQEESFVNGTASYRWFKGNNSLEVLIPGHKHGDYEHKEAQIIMKSCRRAYLFSGMTSSHEYSLDMLNYLLYVLNKSR